MKLRKIALLLNVCLFTFLISCSDEKDDSYHRDDKVEATISAGISTRATDVMWDVDDEIGIAMFDTDYQNIQEDIYNNRYYTATAAGNFVPVSPSDIVYFPGNGNEVRFRSYYPYNANVGRDLMIPVSVTDQSDMTKIDLMTAEHLSGFSKEDPNVSLRFYHRLSKAIFRLNVADDVNGIAPEDVTLTVKGMRTTGTYNLINETLTVDDSSIEDLVVPGRSAANERIGIVMPRPAGEGVSFELTTPQGSIFTANMDSDLPINPGYKYTFNILLQGTEISVSVTIEDWVEGPVTSYDIVGVNIAAGESFGAIVGDVMNVYIKRNNEFEPLSTFTYGEDGKWTTPTPVFWEDIEGNSVDLKASIVPREAAKNATQIPDILITDELSVERNTGANFVFHHAGSKVVVELQSNVFSEDDLDAASITLPNYLGGGTLEKGAFIPGSGRMNILVDKSNLQDQFAIIQPQSVSPEGSLVTINVGGRNFTAHASVGGFQYEAGVAYKLVVMVNESDVSVSARIIDWVDGGTTNYDVLGVTTPAGDSYGAETGDQMKVYMRDGNEFQDFRTFTYGANGVWTTPSPVYWDEISANSINLRAALVPRAPAKNATQLADILIADELSVPRNSGADFIFNHAGSRVVVELRSDVFSQQQLDDAIITLPNYFAGGREDMGVFIPGTVRQNILIDRSNPEDQFAIIQPQSVSPEAALVNVNIDDKIFTARAGTSGFSFEAGVINKFIITVNESEVSVSARVIDWVLGSESNIIAD